jgi:hypothetical protein
MRRTTGFTPKPQRHLNHKGAGDKLEGVVDAINAAIRIVKLSTPNVGRVTWDDIQVVEVTYENVMS